MGHMWCALMDSVAPEIIGIHWACMVRDDSVSLRAPPARPSAHSARRVLCSCGGSASLNKGAVCAAAVGRRPTSSPAGGARDGRWARFR